MKTTSLAIVSTVKAQPDEIRAWVTHHLNIGAKALIIYFDSPEDPVYEEISKMDLVHCILCDEQHYAKVGLKADSNLLEKQKHNATAGLSLARELKCDWIAHIDSDEFISPVESLSAAINKIPEEVSVVKMSLREAIPAKLDPKSNLYEEIIYFKRVVDPISIKQIKKTGLLKKLKQREFLNGHSNSKSITKITDDIKFIGVHIPRFIDSGNDILKPMVLDDIRLLHYDCVSFKNWCKKWDWRVTATEYMAQNGKKRRVQLEEYLDAKNKSTQELEHVYKSYYYLQEAELQQLVRSGLVEKLISPIVS